MVEKLFLGVIGLLLLFLAFVLVDWTTGGRQSHEVLVRNTMYEAARTGTGIASTSNGGTGVVVTSSGPEYSLSVEFADGRRDIVKTNKNTLLSVEVGSTAILRCWHGRFSGSIYSCRL